ncbi:MAG: dienelactone hydrolase family protein [Gammaproteobacteria bacterium]
MDGHEMEGYLALPAGPPQVGLLVLQEIFGVNDHIRKVTDEFAARGFLALAPSLFDRQRPGVELGYNQLPEARQLMASVKIDDVATDLLASVAALRSLLIPPGSKVGAVGYCWGGAIADLAACRTDISAGVAYYGRANVNWLDEQPNCPMLYHFGANDPVIPRELVQQIRAGRPDGESSTSIRTRACFNSQ